MAQLGIPANQAARTEVTVQAFDWQETFDNPRRIIDLVTSKTPASQPVFVIRKEAFDVPDYVDETHETKKIDAQRVRQFAAWAIGGEQYRLIHEDYQSGNASTANTQYLHMLSWTPPGQVGVVDLSTRLLAEGRIQNQDDALPHLLPSDLDIVTIVAGRYLLASGHWLHDSDRWALAYDLRADKILFFNGALPNGTTTKSLSMTADGQVFIAANSSGQLYFYNMATGRQILTGYYVDDELAIYDVNAYYMSTLEGSQFVFLKISGASRLSVFQAIWEDAEPARHHHGYACREERTSRARFAAAAAPDAHRRVRCRDGGPSHCECQSEGIQATRQSAVLFRWPALEGTACQRISGAHRRYH